MCQKAEDFLMSQVKARIKQVGEKLDWLVLGLQLKATQNQGLTNLPFTMSYGRVRLYVDNFECKVFYLPEPKNLNYVERKVTPLIVPTVVNMFTEALFIYKTDSFMIKYVIAVLTDLETLITTIAKSEQITLAVDTQQISKSEETTESVLLDFILKGIE